MNPDQTALEGAVCSLPILLANYRPPHRLILSRLFNINPDQIAPKGAGWSWSIVIAKIYADPQKRNPCITLIILP